MRGGCGALKSVQHVKSHIHNKIVKLFRNGIKNDKSFMSTTQINAVGRPRRNSKAVGLNSNCHHELLLSTDLESGFHGQITDSA